MELIKVRREIKEQGLADIRGCMASELERVGFSRSIKPGDRVALALGSRKIAALQQIVASLVEVIFKAGGRPFIVPAMGSHGGASPQGQREVLLNLGIDAHSLGVDIEDDLEVEEIGRAGEFPVYFSRSALSAAQVVVINKVKQHTDFSGEHESGLAKMLVVGLGKHKQAQLVHSRGVEKLSQLILPCARVVLEKAPVTLGIGVIENARGEITEIRAAPAAEILRVDRELLVKARAQAPKLPVEELDILLVDEMGKDISGTGMDTNVIGRRRIPGGEELSTPRISRIIVLDLSEASGGNALGVGLADITTTRLEKKIDYATTYKNVITSTFLERGKIPVLAKNDREAWEIALATCGQADTDNLRVMRIKNTAYLEEVYMSPRVWEECALSEKCEILKRVPLTFDEQGNLPDF